MVALVKAVQELYEKNEEQRKTIDDQQKLINDLSARVFKMETAGKQ